MPRLSLSRAKEASSQQQQKQAAKHNVTLSLSEGQSELLGGPDATAEQVVAALVQRCKDLPTSTSSTSSSKEDTKRKSKPFFKQASSQQAEGAQEANKEANKKLAAWRAALVAEHARLPQELVAVVADCTLSQDSAGLLIIALARLCGSDSALLLAVAPVLGQSAAFVSALCGFLQEPREAVEADVACALQLLRSLLLQCPPGANAPLDATQVDVARLCSSLLLYADPSRETLADAATDALLLMRNHCLARPEEAALLVAALREGMAARADKGLEHASVASQVGAVGVHSVLFTPAHLSCLAASPVFAFLT